MASAFARTTAVTPLGDGRYGCDLDAGWAAIAGINGGILVAIVARAIEAEVDSERQLRSLHVQFQRPPKARPAQVTVEQIRTGARATNVRVRMEQDGKTIVEALGTCFTGGLHDVATWTPPLPAVPAAADGTDASSDPRMPSLADHVDYRAVIGPPPFSGTPLEPGEPARTGGWVRLKDPHRIDIPALAFFVDSWWPAALGPIDTVAFNPTIDLTLHIRTALPADGLDPQPVLVEALTQANLEGLCDEDVRVFSADGTLLAQARQLAITLSPDDRPMVTRADHTAID
jgi:acyl-CoA thioesterase